METRDALEEQLQRARKRADQCLSLEAAMIKLKREANDIALVRDKDNAISLHFLDLLFFVCNTEVCMDNYKIVFKYFYYFSGKRC
jgi:hypothetical protein